MKTDYVKLVKESLEQNQEEPVVETGPEAEYLTIGEHTITHDGAGNYMLTFADGRADEEIQNVMVKLTHSDQPVALN
jgi:hypothetical protein